MNRYQWAACRAMSDGTFIVLGVVWGPWCAMTVGGLAFITWGLCFMMRDRGPA